MRLNPLARYRARQSAAVRFNSDLWQALRQLSKDNRRLAREDRERARRLATDARVQREYDEARRTATDNPEVLAARALTVEVLDHDGDTPPLAATGTAGQRAYNASLAAVRARDKERTT